MLGHLAPIEHHADADEEQAQQHVVKRPDVGLHLMLVFGLRDQHASNEGAQSQAQASQLGQPGQGQRDEQEVEHEQLLALAPRHQGEPPAHQALPARKQEADQDDRFEQGHPNGRHHLLGWRAQRRDEHEQGHDGQILKQQDAHDAPAMLAVELDAVRQQLDHKCGAAHGRGPGQGQRALPGQLPQAWGQPADQQRTRKNQHHRQRHLQQAQTENVLAHRAQFAQVELQPDNEHQEHHAELAQVAHALSVLGQGQRIGPDQDPHGQVAQHGGQLEGAADHHPQHCGQEVKQGEFQP